MKNILLLFLISFSNFFHAQNTIDDKGRKQGNWIKKIPQSNAIDYTGQFKDDKPVGNKWSYDTENRLPLPKNIKIPEISKIKETKNTIVLKKFIELESKLAESSKN